jgi:hypothetical protein
MYSFSVFIEKLNYQKPYPFAGIHFQRPVDMATYADRIFKSIGTWAIKVVSMNISTKQGRHSNPLPEGI